MLRKIPQETTESIHRLYNDGYSYKETAKKAGVSYSTAYFHIKAREKGFKSVTAYQNYLLQKRGFKSNAKYKKYLDSFKQRRRKNIKLGMFITEKLKETGKNPNWLAEMLDCSRQMVHCYAQGKSIPSSKRIEKLFSVFGIKCKTLEEFVESDY